MTQSASAVTEPGPVAPVVTVRLARACRDLLELLGGVSDGRSDQGRDHPVAAVLALAAAATVAGMRGYTAITGWVADVPADVRADVYMRAGAAPAGPPGKSTIWRVCTGADAPALDAVIGTWLMNNLLTYATEPDTDNAEKMLVQVRLDGKTVRGAKDAEGNQLHLLAALAGTPDGPLVVAAQAEVTGAKTEEVTHARHVLEHIDLDGKLVTADALHTVKAHASYIREQGGHFLFPVKENRRALFDALDTLPWDGTEIAHTSTDKGHGRITTRTIRVLPAPDDLPFPHVSQVFLIERYVTATDGTPISAVAQLGVASPGPTLATPADLARHVQSHWAVEVLHWIRDTCWREDNSTTRTRSGPHVLASLRNLAHGAFRLTGRTSITEATRWAGRYMTRPFTILGLTT